MQPMKLREAIRLLTDCAQDRGYAAAAHTHFRPPKDELVRARAIVDALVSKYEDWCEWDGMRGSLGEDEGREKVDAGFREVRALERGEDV